MRLFLAALMFPLPAAAWEFSPTPICTLTDTQPQGTITVTYDAAVPEYAIAVTADAPWAEGIFFIEFAGARPLTISTDRQILSADARTLTVRDSGFGNVLNGMEFNQSAYAAVGANGVTLSLAGIAPAMAAFRACPADTPPLS